MRSSLSTALALGVAIGAGVVCPVSAVAALQPLTWSAPQRIANQRPFSNFAGAEVSCPSSSLCLMGDAAGEVEVLSNPGAKHQGRAVMRIPGASSFDQLTCPSTTLCVGADAGGNVITSADPTAGAGAWTVIDLDSEYQLSCPSATECVGVDGGGNVVTSTDPAGGASAWSVSRAPEDLARISCPTVSMCVALDLLGNLYVSADPADGASTWAATGAPGLGPIYTALSCPTTTLCAATAITGTVSTSQAPATGTPWNSADVDGSNQLLSVACSSGSECVAGDSAGNVVTASHPATGGWAVANVDGTRDISSLSCPATSFCAGADGADDALLSSAPTGGLKAWNVVHYGGYDPLVSVDCPASTSCVAVDGAGDHVLSTSAPASGSWKLVTPAGELPEMPEIWQVACASKESCVALITDGGAPGFTSAAGALYSFDPVGGAHGFRRVGIRGVDVGGLTEVSCPTKSLCAARDGSGDVFTSRRATSANAWKKVKVTSRTPRLFAISCPTRSLCVSLHPDPATKALPSGSLFISSRGMSGPFKSVDVDGHNGLTGVSCPRYSPCVAVDNSGNVLFAAHPLRGPWQPTHVDPWPLTGVGCASRSLCVAVDAGGRAVIGAPAKGP